jgi:hypothetical protein
MVAAHLARHIRSRIGASGGNTNADVKVDPLCETGIKNTCGIYAPQAAAYVYNAKFHPVPPQKLLSIFLLQKASIF